ncbi:MAG: response regulator transcription factor [Sphingobacteriales bacterium]|nr:MAG: response regulator transcription factor [Sphingobacteriales bacterium]
MLGAIIVDDESNSRNGLKEKISRYCPEVQVIAESENGENGIRLIEALKPDIVFLDVEMPKMNGFTMLQKLTSRHFEVIFITGYDHYAINAIKVSALDYLVKPVEISELKEAVLKAINKRTTAKKNEQVELLLQNLLNDKKEQLRIAIPSTDGLQFTDISSIIYLEASSNYTIFFLTNKKKLTVGRTLKEYEELLPENIFIRIHHSYIINKNFVQKYIRGEGGQVVMQNNVVLDVAKRRKAEFLKIFAKK